MRIYELGGKSIEGPGGIAVKFARVGEGEAGQNQH